METPETDQPEDTKSSPTDILYGISCAEVLTYGSILVMPLTFRFNLFLVFFPIIAILVVRVQKKYRLLSGFAFRFTLCVILLLCTFLPVDIAFRPAPTAEVKILPLIQCRQSMEGVRRAIYAGKRENIDFIAAISTCCGPAYAKHAVVFFYPSRYTSRFGEKITHDEAGKYVQHTIKMMEDWERRKKEREQNQ